MIKKLTYGDVMNLPDNHPLWAEFTRQIKEDDVAHEGFYDYSIYDDEESKEYFDRFIAGDRK